MATRSQSAPIGFLPSGDRRLSIGCLSPPQFPSRRYRAVDSRGQQNGVSGFSAGKPGNRHSCLLPAAPSGKRLLSPERDVTPVRYRAGLKAHPTLRGSPGPATRQERKTQTRPRLPTSPLSSSLEATTFRLEPPPTHSNPDQIPKPSRRLVLSEPPPPSLAGACVVVRPDTCRLQPRRCLAVSLSRPVSVLSGPNLPRGVGGGWG